VYLYSDTREGGLLQTTLKDFKGVTDRRFTAALIVLAAGELSGGFSVALAHPPQKGRLIADVVNQHRILHRFPGWQEIPA
jgi:hypothetical protein